jgi:hypothetical protein
MPPWPPKESKNIYGMAEKCIALFVPLVIFVGNYLQELALS